VIASSPSDVQPVFEAIAESAARLCEAEFCNVFRFDGELIHFMHSYGYSREAIEALRHFYPMRPDRGSCAGRAILDGKVEQVPDIRADREYAQGNVPDIMKVSSIVAVPMVKERRPVGAIALVRAAKGTFPQRQVNGSWLCVKARRYSTGIEEVIRQRPFRASNSKAHST
jgi:hypothetical protein